MRTWTIQRSTELPRARDEVWSMVTTMEGVNAELRPWIRMSAPPVARSKTLADVPLGKVAFHSWLLLFGFLPFDRHALRLDEVEEGRFLERSSSWMQALWQHERIVEDTERGCRVTDVVTLSPRVALLGPVARWVAGAVFSHRHRQLARRWRSD